ncbi:hypothetical protein LCGC14_0267090 [marine sediment metagenome]|uniref:LamG-like jellyroll fold domain-containing protein n=1 Tax=marine sediment metagenome TaxID=412755 RepID=A0A0F9X4Q4_9ZZZZ
MIDEPRLGIKFGDHWIYEQETVSFATNIMVSQYTTGLLEQKQHQHSFDLTITTIYEPELFQALKELMENDNFAVQGLQWTTSYDGVVIITGAEFKEIEYVTKTITAHLKGSYNKLRLNARSTRLPIPNFVAEEDVDTNKRRQHGIYDHYETFSSVPSHWETLVGIWSVGSGFLFTTSSTTYNSIRATPYHTADFICSISFNFGGAETHAGIYFRIQSSYAEHADSDDAGYYYHLNGSTVDNIKINRNLHGASDVTIWDHNLGVNVSTTDQHTLTVIASGDTFYLYYNGKFYVKIIDPTWVTGGVGVRTGSSSTQFQSFHCEILRDNPIVRIPNWQAISRRHSSSRGWLDTSRGLINKIVYAREPVDYVPWLGRVGDEDVKVWDTNENKWTEDKGFFLKPLYWSRVYDPNHTFKGDCVIENGIMAYVQTSQTSMIYLYPDVFRFRTMWKQSLTAGGTDTSLPNPRMRRLDVIPEQAGRSYNKDDHLDLRDQHEQWIDRDDGSQDFHHAPLFESRETDLTYGHSFYVGKYSFEGWNIYTEVEFTVEQFSKWRSSTEFQGIFSNTDDFQNDGFYIYVTSGTTQTIYANFGNDASGDTVWNTGVSIDPNTVTRIMHILSQNREMLYKNGILVAVRDRSKTVFIQSGRTPRIGSTERERPWATNPLNGKISYAETGLRNRGETMPVSNDTPVCWITFDHNDWDNGNTRMTDKSENGLHLLQNVNNLFLMNSHGRFNEWAYRKSAVIGWSMGWIDGLETPIGTTWSISLTFMYINTPAAATSYLLFIINNGAGEAVAIFIQDNNTFDVNINGTIVGAVPIVINTIHRVLISWDDGSLNIYLDGVLQTGSPFTTPTPTFTSNFNMYLGGNGANVISTYDGYMDEFMVWDKVITPDEDGVVIKDQYKTGEVYLKSEFRYIDKRWVKRPTDRWRAPIYWFSQHSDNGRSIQLDSHGSRVVEGAEVVTNPGFKFPGITGDFMWAWKSRGGVEFNHTGDIEFPTVFSLQFSVYIFTLPASHMLPFELFNTSYETTVYCRIYSDGDIEFALVGTGGVSRYMITTDTPLAVNTLYTISFRCDIPNDTGKIVINGTEHTVTKTGTAQTTIRNLRYMRIGRYVASEFHNGAIGNIIIHDYWLKDEELGFFVDKQMGPSAGAIIKHYSETTLTAPHFNKIELEEIRPDFVRARIKEGAYQTSYEMKFRGDIGGIVLKNYKRYGSQKLPANDLRYFHIMRDDNLFPMATYNPIGTEFGNVRLKVNVFGTRNDDNAIRYVDSRRDVLGSDYPIAATLNHVEIIHAITYSASSNVIWVSVYNYMTPGVDGTADFSTEGGTKNYFTDNHLFWVERGDFDDGQMETGLIPIPYFHQIFYPIGDMSANNGGSLSTYLGEQNPSTIYFSVNNQYVRWSNIYLEAGSYAVIVGARRNGVSQTLDIDVSSGSKTLTDQVTNSVNTDDWNNQIFAVFTVDNEFLTDIQVEVRMNGSGFVFTDGMWIIPISNGHNYPMDIIHQFMSETKISRQVIKDVD